MSIRLYQKNELLIKVNLKDDVDTALDISDANVYFVVSNDSGEVVISKSTEDDTITVLDASEGQIEFLITKEDSDLTTANLNYNSELLVIDLNGHRYTASQPSFTIIKSFSKGVG